MRENIKFIYPETLVPCGPRRPDGLTKVIKQEADGSLNAKDLGVSFELSQAARDELARARDQQIVARQWWRNHNQLIFD